MRHRHGGNRAQILFAQLFKFKQRIVLCFLNKSGVLVMRYYFQRIQILITGRLAERQAQASSDSLLSQYFAYGSAQGDNGVKVVHIPALFKHVHMHHDFNRACGAFHRQKPLDILVAFRAGFAGMYFYDFSLIASATKSGGFNVVADLGRVCGVFGGNKHKRLYERLLLNGAVFGKAGFFHLMACHTIQKFEFFKLRFVRHGQIGASYYRR